MARDYVIQVQGALRTERSLLDTERELAEELRQATREARALLMEAAIDAAPTPDAHTGQEKGEGVGSTLNMPGGVRRLAGRAVGGKPLVSLTYEVTLFVEAPSVAAIFETGSGLFGPHGSPFPIYPTEGKALHLPGWGGSPNSPKFGDPFRGGLYKAGERKPIFDHVNHPGMPARPFLEKTVRDHADLVDALYERAVSDAVNGP